jgi:hypothetical protein
MSRDRASIDGEQRVLPRLQIQLPAMAFPGGNCRILDLTAVGARIQFDGPAPDLEQLVVLELDSGRAHDALAVWRRGSEVGLRLRSAAYMHEPAEPLFAEAEAFWLSQPDRRSPVTTFRLVQNRRQWEVTVQGPAVASFLYRWKAERYAREQVRTLRGKGISAAFAA